MADEQAIGFMVTVEERARIGSRSAASDAIIQFQHGRIAVLEAEAQRRDALLVERGALVEQLQQTVVELTRQVIGLGGQPTDLLPAEDAPAHVTD